MKKKQILMVGKAWATLKFFIKGFDVIPHGGYEDWSVYFKEPMSKYDDLEISHIPNYLVLSMFPQTMEQLSKFDVIIISDCGRNTLTNYPDMYKVPMGPDRIALIADYVRQGGALIMTGGYVDFQGFQGKGNYHGSAIEEVLPVNIMATDDRVEPPQGVEVKILKSDHPILEGIPKEWPLFIGYQKVFPKKGSEVLATIGEDDPMIVLGETGKGRAMAFTTDLTPHWGTAFAKWEYYSKFWYQVINWLTR
ncbi:MAG: hypothetical protein JXB49_32830 [Bacteroidales bacterium]|nr:hypothetical protein [Bacteroidales bacterium]